MNCDRIFKQFRTGFLGKASPVHFFWGSFDLAVTRFSGRRAPRHPGGVPNLPDAVACEAYSHEDSSAGFWPGSGAVDYPAFYSYAYPEPAGFRAAKVRPEAAFFSEALGEFILPYDAVRTADDPDQALLDFLQSTYEAAAISANWDRDALECDPGQAGRGAAGLELRSMNRTSSNFVRFSSREPVHFAETLWRINSRAASASAVESHQPSPANQQVSSTALSSRSDRTRSQPCRNASVRRRPASSS